MHTVNVTLHDSSPDPHLLILFEEKDRSFRLILRGSRNNPFHEYRITLYESDIRYWNDGKLIPEFERNKIFLAIQVPVQEALKRAKQEIPFHLRPWRVCTF